MKQWLHILFFLLAMIAGSYQVAAQDIVGQSVIELQKGDLPKAKELIDKGSMLQPYASQARTWYYKGYIYKELFKANQTMVSYRDSALGYLFHSIELDKAGEFTESSAKIINYLLSSIYNEVALYLNEIASNELSQEKIAISSIMGALSKYEYFKQQKQRLQPSADFKQMDEEIYMQVANIYFNLFETSSYSNEDYFMQARYHYEKVLSINSANVSALYNLGISYYNKAAHIINNMDYGVDLEILEKRMEECSNLFEKSLPYMQKAYELNPNNVNVLIALKGIYYGLNNYEMSDYYDAKLKSLNR